jgi:hypothetical protein
MIIQTILQYPSGPVWTDDGANLGRLDPSGSDQSDAEQQATDLVLGSPIFSLARRQARAPPRVATEVRLMLVSPARGAATAPRPQRPVAVRRGRAGGGIAVSAYRVILRVVFWVILSVVLVAASFWVYAIVTGGKNL